MRYIKPYKIFESKEDYRLQIEEALDTIDDIALELNDIGIRLDYSGTLLTINIVKDYSPMSIVFTLNSTVVDIIHRLYSYLVDIIFINFAKISIHSTNNLLGIRGINRARDFIEFTDINEFDKFIEEYPDLSVLRVHMSFPEVWQSIG